MVAVATDGGHALHTFVADAGEVRIVDVSHAPAGAALASRARRLLTHEARRLVVPLAILTVISSAGTAAAPSLVAADQPLLLVALSPRLAFLTLAAKDASLVPFLAVGLLRLCVADPFHFALGKRHGAMALDRIPGAIGRAIVRVRAVAMRCVPVLVFLRPNGTNLAIAGAARSNRVHVAIADVVGTVAYLLVIRAAGSAFI